MIEDGFDAVSVSQIAVKVAMLNREFTVLWREILDDIDRDPRGGLLSHIYRYTLTGIYVRPLVRALYLADRDGGSGSSEN